LPKKEKKKDDVIDEDDFNEVFDDV